MNLTRVNIANFLFCTLTFRQDDSLDNFKWNKVARFFNDFVTNLRANYGMADLQYLRMNELHLSGFPHIHTILYSRSGFKTFESYMHKKNGWLVDNSINESVHNAWLTHGDIVDIVPALNPTSALMYMTKYITKDADQKSFFKRVFKSVVHHKDKSKDKIPVPIDISNYNIGSLKNKHDTINACIAGIKSGNYDPWMGQYMINIGLPFDVSIHKRELPANSLDHYGFDSIDKRLQFLDIKLSGVISKIIDCNKLIESAYNYGDIETEKKFVKIVGVHRDFKDDSDNNDKNNVKSVLPNNAPKNFFRLFQSRFFPLYQLAYNVSVKDRVSVKKPVQKKFKPVYEKSVVVNDPRHDKYSMPSKRIGF